MAYDRRYNTDRNSKPEIKTPVFQIKSIYTPKQIITSFEYPNLKEKDVIKHYFFLLKKK
jgi:hypothetical protein